MVIDRPFNPRPKGAHRRPRSAAQERDAMPGKAEAARRFKIAVCGTLSPAVNAHHVLEKSWLMDAAWREGFRGLVFWDRVYDPGVAISLPTRIHEAHTNRVAVIPYEAIPRPVLAHVERVWGDAGLLAVEREHPRSAA